MSDLFERLMKHHEELMREDEYKRPQLKDMYLHTQEMAFKNEATRLDVDEAKKLLSEMENQNPIVVFMFAAKLINIIDLLQNDLYKALVEQDRIANRLEEMFWEAQED